MTNQKEKRKVPELRFPEFSGEWGEKKLSQMSSGGQYGLNSAATNFDGENVYVRITDIDESTRKLSGKLTSPSSFSNDYKLNDNDLLFARTGASTGKSYLHKNSINNYNYYFAGFLIRFVMDIEFDSNFIYQNTLTSKYDKWTRIMSMRSGQPGINSKEYESLMFNVPTFKEQQKIGEFFSKLDRQIELEEKKLTLLEEQKKGYMQKIFSQELRFKDENGEEYPEWEKSRVSDFGKVVTGNTPSKNEIRFWENGKYIWVTPSDINQLMEINSSNFLLSEEGYKRSRKLPKNTLLITCIASIGKNAILKSDGACNQQINAIIPNNENNVEFLYFLMEHYKEYLITLSGKTATNIINKNDFEKIEFSVPKYNEQIKIGEFLTRFENEISIIKRKIILRNMVKKNLLNSLLI